MAFIKSKVGNGGSSGVTVKTGTLSKSSANQSVSNLGFKPKKLYIYTSDTGAHCMYDESVSTTKFIRCVPSSSNPVVAWTNIGSTSAYSIVSIDSNGFTFKGSTSYAFTYFALDG